MKTIAPLKDPRPDFPQGDPFRACSEAFDAKFPTEESCWNELITQRGALGLLACQKCGSQKLTRLSLRIIRCNDCRGKKSASAGTVFERNRKLRPYFAAIWFLEHGIPINSVQLHNFADLAQSSALGIQRKLRCVIETKIKDDDDDDVQSMQTVQIVQTYFFSNIMTRRSFETPARQHPRDEELVYAGTTAGVSGMGSGTATSGAAFASTTGSTTSGTATHVAPPAGATTTDNADSQRSIAQPSLSENEKKIFDLLHEGPKSFDQLIRLTAMSPNELSFALTTLEIEGLITQSIGGDYRLMDSEGGYCPGKKGIPSCSTTGAKTKQPNFEVKPIGTTLPLQLGGPTLHGVALISRTLQQLEQDVRDFIVNNFNGVSRKYLQLYMADYWCHWDRNRWSETSVLIAGILFKPIAYRELKQFVTASTVRVPTSFSTA